MTGLSVPSRLLQMIQQCFVLLKRNSIYRSVSLMMVKYPSPTCLFSFFVNIYSPFKPFNDCPLSLKGCANLAGETAPSTEKRFKKRKNKTAESVERLISTHFSGFPLYQFQCCDVHRYNEIDTIQRCIPTL